MKKALSLFFFAILLSITLAAKSTIRIHFPGAENQKAIVWTYADYISYTKKFLGTYDINASGDFEFTNYAGSVKPLYIQVKFMRFSFFAEPGKDYVIQVRKTDFRNPELYPKNTIAYIDPGFSIIKPRDKELNHGLEQINLMFSSFVDSNYLFLIRGQNTKYMVDSFAGHITHFTDSFDNDFLNDYVGFQMAELHLLNHDFSYKMVVDKFFSGKKLDLNNPYLMEFFNSFWSNYLTSKAQGYSPTQLDSVINQVQSYQALSALVGRDPLLKDSILRELVIIRNIPQMYSGRRFKKSALVDILSDIARSDLRKEHQFIATNVRKRMLQRQTGSPAPDFHFTSIEGKEISLERLQGKYIYINIWNTECEQCLAEMEYTKELYQDFDDIIEFVSISVDQDTAFMSKYAREREYQWHIAPIGEELKFLYDYNVDVLPRYILIDKNGHIEMWNAPSPSNHFSDYFLKMLNDKKGNLELQR